MQIGWLSLSKGRSHMRVGYYGRTIQACFIDESGSTIENFQRARPIPAIVPGSYGKG